MQLLYGERVLAQVAFASRRHCVVRHEHRLSWAYRSAAASAVMFSWWSELSRSSCQLLPSPLCNHTHNKQIFTSPTTGFFFFADLSAGFWHHKSTGWFVTFILTPQRGLEYQLCYTSVFFYRWHLLHREMWSLVTSCGSLSGGVGWFNHVITVKMMF